MQTESICRCCLAKGPLKDLNTTYIWFNKEEIYSEMLNECFNIPLHKFKSGKICDACIKSLRRSVVFKQQVLNCEQEFLKHITYEVEINDQKPVFIKKEPVESPADIVDETDDNLATDAVIEKETPLVIKIESQLSLNKELTVKKVEQKRSNKRSNSPKKKITKPPVKWQTDKIKCLVTKLANKINDTPTKIKKERAAPALEKFIRIRTGTLKQQLPTITSVTTMKRIVCKPITDSKHQKKSTITLIPRVTTEQSKYKETLQTILEYSNATPFKDKSLVGYICGYCDATYPDPKDLRKHTVDDHSEDRLKFKPSFGYTKDNVKMDVTDLHCKLCEEKMDNLKVFKEHLVKTHNKTIHSDIKDLILQFKLKKGEGYDCAMCPVSYETFKMLKQHMNKHYSNFSCNKCESTFANKRSLNVHKSTHEEGNFKCNYCDKIFASKPKRTYHEKLKHLGVNKVRNCPHCNMEFRNYYQRNQHLVQVHNSEAQYKCNVCDKTYMLKSLLTAHIKRSHLMERNNQCSECDFRCFSKKVLKAHMVTHTGEKNYSCDVCQKAYARKYTLREHMRIHNNDRRFKCEICSNTFVQKCSLKSHLLSNHGINMAANEITGS